jgi:hypothetical protein
MVVEDGASEVDAQPRAKSGWVLVAVGFGLGLALGTLVAAPRDDPIAGDVTEPATRSTIAEEAEDLLEMGVTGAVPEFPDALVAVGQSVGSGHDHLLWPVGGSLVVRSMTGGEEIQLDATGQYVALSEVAPDLAGRLLSAGRFNRIRLISSGVTSYVWHDTASGQLAYTTEDEDEWRLYRMSGGFDPSLVVSGEASGATLAAWGDWGFAMQLSDGRVQLLTLDGEPKDIEAGVALASHGSGWVLVEDDSLKLVSAGGGVRLLQDADAPAEILAAAFSPNGDRVALAGREGVVVLDPDNLDETIRVPGSSGGWVRWSSDSRFVVGPAQNGMRIHDLENEASHQVLLGHRILTAAVLPLSSS